MNENLENLKQKANQFFHDENWDELFPICTEMIELEQEPHAKAFAYVRRGAAYGKKGDPDKAIVDFTKALEFKPNDAETYLFRGLEYIPKGDLDHAIADFKRALERKRDYARAYLCRGFAYNLKGDPDHAIADFNEALRLEPDDTVKVEAHLWRGFAYLAKHNYDDAIGDFETILELSPADEQGDRRTAGAGYLGRGNAYIGKRNFLNAFEDFVEANKCDPVLKAKEPIIYIASRIADIYKNSAKEKSSSAFERYRKLFDTIIKIQEKLFYLPEEGKEVAHYTCIHTLKKLAGKGRFRLYNAAYMNDPEEGRVFFDVMKEFEIDVENIFYGKDNDEDPPYPSPAYIGSFVRVDSSEQEPQDKLFLWRTYGKHDGQEAAGACLVFKHDGTCFAETRPEPQIGAMQQLQSSLLTAKGDHENPKKRQHSEPETRQPPKPALYKIVYKEKGNDQKLSEELGKELNELAESLKQIEEHVSEEDANRKEQLKQLVRDLLDNIRFLFKASHYNEEGEVRVVQIRYYDQKNTSQEVDGLQVDTQQIPPRFYLDTHNNFRFSEVILGPKAHGVPEWKRWLKEQDDTLIVEKSRINYGQR